MAKTTKSGKANKSLVSGGMIVVVVAVILIIACFFTYISGILPQTLTGITITENNPDGTSKNIKNYSVLESNFHFKEVYDSYSQYGMVSADTLDNVSNQETGDTYRDVLLREAAGQMKTLTLVERAAKESGFMEISKAREISAKNLETLELNNPSWRYMMGNKNLTLYFYLDELLVKLDQYMSENIIPRGEYFYDTKPFAHLYLPQTGNLRKVDIKNS